MPKDKAAKERKRKQRKKEQRVRDEQRRVSNRRASQSMLSAVFEGSSRGWAAMFNKRPGGSVVFDLPEQYAEFEQLLTSQPQPNASPPREIMMRVRDQVRTGPSDSQNGFAFVVEADDAVRLEPLPDALFWSSIDPMYWLKRELHRAEGARAAFWVLWWELGPIPLTAVLGVNPNGDLGLWFVEDSEFSHEEQWHAATHPEGLLSFRQFHNEEVGGVSENKGLAIALEMTGAIDEGDAIEDLDPSDPLVGEAVDLVQVVQRGLLISLLASSYSAFMNEQYTSSIEEAIAKVPGLETEKRRLEARLQAVGRELDRARSAAPPRVAAPSPAPRPEPAMTLQQRLDGVFA